MGYQRNRWPTLRSIEPCQEGRLSGTIACWSSTPAQLVQTHFTLGGNLVRKNKKYLHAECLAKNLKEKWYVHPWASNTYNLEYLPLHPTLRCVKCSVFVWYFSLPPPFSVCVCIAVVVFGMEPRTAHTLGKHCITKSQLPTLILTFLRKKKLAFHTKPGN